MEYNMGGIYGTLCLGIVQEKCMYLHWESNLVHNMDLREPPLERYQV